MTTFNETVLKDNQAPKDVILLNTKGISKELIQLETKIYKANVAFYDIGEALNTICNRRLYIERGFKSFEMYVQEKFDFSRNYAYKMIDAYTVYRYLSDLGYKGNQLPKTESQCRPMAKLCDEKFEMLAEVWAGMQMETKITAEKITIAVNKALGIIPAITPDTVKSETKEVKKDDKSGIQKTLEGIDTTGSNTEVNTPIDTTISLEAELNQYKVRCLQLQQEVIKLRSNVNTSVPKSKMAIELYKAGFKALAASATPEQMEELMSLKSALIG